MTSQNVLQRNLLDIHVCKIKFVLVHLLHACIAYKPQKKQRGEIAVQYQYEGDN